MRDMMSAMGWGMGLAGLVGIVARCWQLPRRGAAEADVIRDPNCGCCGIGAAPIRKRQ
jgi:hypothetical protein